MNVDKQGNFVMQWMQTPGNNDVKCGFVQTSNSATEPQYAVKPNADCDHIVMDSSYAIVKGEDGKEVDFFINISESEFTNAPNACITLTLGSNVNMVVLNFNMAAFHLVGPAD